MKISRRKFLGTSAAVAGGALVVGFKLYGQDSAEGPGAAKNPFDAWIHIRPDSSAELVFAQSEMGQGRLHVAAHAAGRRGRPGLAARDDRAVGFLSRHRRQRQRDEQLPASAAGRSGGAHGNGGSGAHARGACPNPNARPARAKWCMQLQDAGLRMDNWCRRRAPCRLPIQKPSS